MWPLNWTAQKSERRDQTEYGKIVVSCASAPRRPNGFEFWIPPAQRCTSNPHHYQSSAPTALYPILFPNWQFDIDTFGLTVLVSHFSSDANEISWKREFSGNHQPIYPHGKCHRSSCDWMCSKIRNRSIMARAAVRMVSSKWTAHTNPTEKRPLRSVLPCRKLSCLTELRMWHNVSIDCEILVFDVILQIVRRSIAKIRQRIYFVNCFRLQIGIHVILTGQFIPNRCIIEYRRVHH